MVSNCGNVGVFCFTFKKACHKVAYARTQVSKDFLSTLATSYSIASLCPKIKQQNITDSLCTGPHWLDSE